MKISVKIKTRARQESVNENGKIFNVSVKELPIEGRANKKVIEILAKYFNKPKSNIKIISGHKSKNKIIEIQ